MAIKQKGFTVVELLIYIAGMILLVGGIAAALYYTFNWFTSVTYGPRVDQTALSLSSRLLGSIRGSATVNDTLSTYNATSGALYLVYSATTTTYSDLYNLQNNRVIYTANGSVTSTALTPADITVSRLWFSKITSAKSQGIRFEFDIPIVGRNGTTTRTYTGFAILRKSYP